MRGQCRPEEALTLADCNATFQQESTDLIDDASALADEPLTHAVERLQIELFDRLRRDELHGWPLHRLGDRLGITEVILLPLRVGSHVFCRHQPGIMSERLEAAAEMMGTDAGLHADQAWRHIGKPRFHLAARPLLTQHNCTALDRGRQYETSSCRYLCRSRRLRSLSCRGTWPAPRLWRPLPASNAGGAGARPDHPITGLGARALSAGECVVTELPDAASEAAP